MNGSWWLCCWTRGKKNPESLNGMKIFRMNFSQPNALMNDLKIHCEIHLMIVCYPYSRIGRRSLNVTGR
jgi:hypothetical protein